MSLDGSRVFQMDGAANVRDLGGLPTTNGGVLRRGRVFRSDVHYRVTGSDATAFPALDIRMVIDLRSSHEVLRYPQSSLPLTRLQHINVPISVETYSETGSLLEDYMLLVRGAGPGFRDVFSHLANGPYPMVINCFAGKDRTGLTSALMLGALGVPNRWIVADYALTRAHMSRFMEIHRSTIAAPVEPGPLPSWLEASTATMELTLAAISDEWGTVRG